LRRLEIHGRKLVFLRQLLRQLLRPQTKWPGPVVSRAQTRWQLPAPQKYRLKIALPARFPQGAVLGIIFLLVSNRKGPLEAKAPK
jgi:hypothetical protein